MDGGDRARADSRELPLGDGGALGRYLVAGPAGDTRPLTYTFDSARVDRTAVLSLFGLTGERPEAVHITVADDTETVVNPFVDHHGAAWDTSVHPLVIPTGATTVIVQTFSRRPGTGQLQQTAGVGSVLGLPRGDRSRPAPFCPKPLAWWRRQRWMEEWGGLTTFHGTCYRDLASAASADPYWDAAAQYVTVEVNRLFGASTSDVDPERGRARRLLAAHADAEDLPPAVADELAHVAEVLEGFNHGEVTPGCC